MAFRTFAVFAIQTTNTPQPLCGSWVTAGLGNPSNAPITLTLGAATTSGNDATNIFAVGSHALLINPPGSALGANAEDVYIGAVSGNTVTLNPKASLGTQPGGLSPVTELAHTSGVFNTGTFIIPNFHANNMFVAREDGGTGVWMYIGNNPSMTATFRRIVKLNNVGANVMPFNYSATENFFGAPFAVSEIYVMGTAADQYNVSFCIL